MQRSRYFVMFSKCEDLSCCSRPRSPLMKILPSRFLPAPRAYTHNDAGELCLVNPRRVDKTVKFASLSNILSQPVQQDLPFDAYNQKVDINKTKCPFCHLSLCSPAELKRHRRAMHYRQRAPGVEPFEVFELRSFEKVVAIIDKSGEEYLCLMEDDEDIEWRRLPPTHPMIPVFEKERVRLLQGVVGGPVQIPSDQLGEFMSSIYEDI